MRTILVVIASALLVGCSRESRTEWILKQEPTTDAERKAVAEHVERILSATPKTLSGHDQDWDDAIEMAHRQAAKYLCKPTLWEWVNAGYGSGYTGRWKYSQQIEETK